MLEIISGFDFENSQQDLGNIVFYWNVSRFSFSVFRLLLRFNTFSISYLLQLGQQPQKPSPLYWFLLCRIYCNEWLMMLPASVNRKKGQSCLRHAAEWRECLPHLSPRCGRQMGSRSSVSAVVVISLTCDGLSQSQRWCCYLYQRCSYRMKGFSEAPPPARYKFAL